MHAFAQLLDRLYFTSSNLEKNRLLRDYFKRTPNPNRGWAVAAISGQLSFKKFKRGLVRELICERVDPALYDLCYDYVGETAETVSHLWPSPSDAQQETLPPLHTIIEQLGTPDATLVRDFFEKLMDIATPTERWALLKLGSGGLRVGVSERFLKQALADYGDVSIDEVESIWHSLQPPYENLFAWLEGTAPKPEIKPGPTFHPVMLAHPIPDERLSEINSDNYIAEWKYDGIRVQAVATTEGNALFSRTGEDISNAFPDIIAALRSNVVLDAELLVKKDGQWGTFNDLQQRLNRKHATQRGIRSSPAYLIIYDILSVGSKNLMGLTLAERQQQLQQWHVEHGNNTLCLSAPLTFQTLDELSTLRNQSGEQAHPHIEGLMLKRKDSVYVPGRPMGQWYKWKRDPRLIDAVMLYAQRGHGKRSSFYSDYTFGLWHKDTITPVGKAYFGFTDEELKALDKWIREHTVSRFGPVREVEAQLVLEIAFDSVHYSPRHKSGVALRFPRINRIRWDKPYKEADQLSTLKAMIVEKPKNAQLDFLEDLKH